MERSQQAVLAPDVVAGTRVCAGRGAAQDQLAAAEVEQVVQVAVPGGELPDEQRAAGIAHVPQQPGFQRLAIELVAGPHRDRLVDRAHAALIGDARGARKKGDAA
jgi:hypothetical protein